MRQLRMSSQSMHEVISFENTNKMAKNLGNQAVFRTINEQMVAVDFESPACQKSRVIAIVSAFGGHNN